MSAVDLLEPILKGGLQRNNFFNGRLFSAEDLRAEQASTDARVAYVGRAGGDGVAWGLDVAITSVGPTRPTVSVTSGLAINRLGNLLPLADAAQVALVPAETDVNEGTGLFAACEPPRATGSLSGTGAYVLTIAPTSGYSGTALVSDPNSTALGRGSCGARLTLEGVRFRLVPIALSSLAGITPALRSQLLGLLPPTGVTGRERLRNLLAHACYGTEALGFADPAKKTAVTPVLTSWGVLDAMRDRGDLTDCDVPLATVVLTSSGISFVDMWAARRRLLDAGAIDSWRGVAGPRRLAEGEATFLQFQSQLEGLRTQSSPGTINASSYLDVLPAGGWLPTGTNGFNWTTFLGPCAPPAVTPVDASLLRAILERSWFDEPFALATNPPVPVLVYEVPEQVTGDSSVLFARSERGNIRVILSPVPAANDDIEVTAIAVTGAVTRAATHQAGTFPVTELVPGVHHVGVAASNYNPVDPIDVTAVGGRTVDVNIALTPLPNGWILVDAIDKRTGQSIAAKVTSVTASGSGGDTHGGTYQSSDGRWRIDDLPPGLYSLTGSAPGYKPATNTNVGPTVRGQSINSMLVFEPDQRIVEQPPKCVHIDRAEKPEQLKNVRMCLVLEATEFDEDYFYRAKEKQPAIFAKSGDELRIAKRTRSSTGSAPGRYVAETGELVYKTAPWKSMVPLVSPRPDITSWLLDWRKWFAIDLDDQRVLKYDPVVYVDPRFQPARNEKEVRPGPPGYAVFTLFAVPVTIKPEDTVTRKPVRIAEERIPGLAEEVERGLYDANIRYIDDLAHAWQELIVDATGNPPESARYLIADAHDAIGPINDSRSYLPGVDKATDKTMRDLGILDDVGLANADVEKLGNKVGSLGFATRLIEQARQIVPAASWSLGDLGLSDTQVNGLNARGIVSKGDLASNAARADGKALIAEALGMDTEEAASRDAAITTLGNNAVMTMAASSVALAPQPSLATWSGIDSLNASSLGKLGITTVDDLAAAKPEDVAAATNLAAADAQKLITDAQGASRGSLGVGILAPVSRAEEKSLKDTLGADVTLQTLASKSPAEIAVAFGGNVGRATSILNGIKAGLGATRALG
jgi:predicted flap endonuclease-1-like 5' DNA nuclease